MSRIFLSHASANNAEAIAIRDWMRAQGWDDVFRDLDPDRGLVAGDRWQATLKTAVDRCELVIFVVSPEWAASSWCKAEFLLTKHGNNPKAILPVIVSPTTISDIPVEMAAEYQCVDLTAGPRSVELTVVLPGGEAPTVTFSEEGLQRLKLGIERSGIDAKHFVWPPTGDPERSPYLGLKPLEAEDAGIFFGRDAAVIEGLDRVRGLREGAPPRLLVILGASGSGKSSFMRAGLLPRLARDDRQFLPLPIIRPERATISGELGFVNALVRSCETKNLSVARADVRSAIERGAGALRPILQALAAQDMPASPDGVAKPKPPTLILPVDQGEELFDPEGSDEAVAFLTILRDLLKEDAPALIALFTIRSDNYERLQLARPLEGLRQQTLSLPPIPKGAYAEVIKGPAQRLAGTNRELRIEEALVQGLLADIEAGGAKDSLPLLAFTLERLYREHGGDGRLTLSDYRRLGGIEGSIEAAVEGAFKAANDDPAIPRDRHARLALLRAALIPWLAGIDPDTGAPRRRVARLSEIPAEARPLTRLLVEQRLLSTDIEKGPGERTIEPAHDTLLRNWGLLQGWLTEDAGLLGVMEGVKRASRDWAANAKSPAWLTHKGDRLATAEALRVRPDLSGNLEPTDWDYLAASRWAEKTAERATRRRRALVTALLLDIIAGLVSWINQNFLKEQWFWATKVRSFVLTAQAEKILSPKDSFRECADCPEMIVIPAGSFLMGSAADQRYLAEHPQHEVAIGRPFAVSKFEITHDDCQACVTFGGCPPAIGSGRQAASSISRDDAHFYAAWLSRMTGKEYRLLTEAEWEYAARAGSTTEYPWGDQIGAGNANCIGCGSQWDNQSAAPVGSFRPNGFGLYEMNGNVFEWVEDNYHLNFDHNPPTDGSVWQGGDPRLGLLRGGSFIATPELARSSYRYPYRYAIRDNDTGLRLARTLRVPSP